LLEPIELRGARKFGGSPQWNDDRKLGGRLSESESGATVYRLVKRKGLPSFRVGRDHRFRRAEIDEWIEAREKAREKP
jgi:excisionase family DNA binding protein